MSLSGIYFALVLLFCACQLYVSIKWRTSSQRIPTVILGSVFLLAICILASKVTTPISSYSDLVRMQDEINITLVDGPSYLFQSYALNPGSALLILIASVFGGIAFLQTFACAIFYGSIMLMIYLMYVRHYLSAYKYFSTIAAALVTAPFGDIIAGVRNYPSLALGLLGASIFYLHRKRMLGLLIIILATSIHFSVLVIIAIILAIHIRDKRLRFIVYVVILGYSYISYQAAIIASNMGIASASSLLQKMDGYYRFGNSYNESFISTTYYLIALFSICVGVLAQIRLSHTYLDDEIFQYKRFSFILLLVCLGSAVTQTPLVRYSILFLFASLPLHGITSVREKYQNHSSDLLLRYVYILLIIGLAYCGYRLTNHLTLTL